MQRTMQSKCTRYPLSPSGIHRLKLEHKIEKKIFFEKERLERVCEEGWGLKLQWTSG